MVEDHNKSAIDEYIRREEEGLDMIQELRKYIEWHASGVFLWVRLVMHKVRIETYDRQSTELVERQVKGLPDELNDLSRVCYTR